MSGRSLGILGVVIAMLCVALPNVEAARSKTVTVTRTTPARTVSVSSSRGDNQGCQCGCGRRHCRCAQNQQQQANYRSTVQQYESRPVPGVSIAPAVMESADPAIPKAIGASPVIEAPAVTVNMGGATTAEVRGDEQALIKFYRDWSGKLWPTWEANLAASPQKADEWQRALQSAKNGSILFDVRLKESKAAFDYAVTQIGK